MPDKDGTGPLGAGSMTGRGAGRCAGFSRPGDANAAQGQGPCGRGLGRRGARGHGRMRFGWGGTPFVATPGTDAEKQMLNEQAQALQAQLDTIKMRLDSMGVDEPAK